mmetsp:Transcript_5732/g.18399  ORF Transcript_5732/g.18399 Transcript_5732/m.18399 type:complete len:225 (-) Transcript_5732:522-1196(-)
MRKRVPSSMVLSKLGAAVLTSVAASEVYSDRATSAPCDAGMLDGLQPGKREALTSSEKSVLRNAAALCRLTVASSSRSLRSFCTWSRVATGGTKSSQSSRLSHRFELKRAFSIVLSSSFRTEPERFFQNARPTNSSPDQLPSSSSVFASVGLSKSNLSRFRSTPLGTPGAAPGASSGISASPVRAWISRWERFGARAMDTFAVGTRPTGTPTRCIWSIPYSTPP